MGWHFHHHHHHLADENIERRMPAREIFARLLRYLIPYKKWIAIVIFAVIITSLTGIASPYILGREIISRYILKGDLAGLQTVILIFIGIQVANWVANILRMYGLGKIGQSLSLIHI